MVQVLKESVRSQILEAAETLFATVGFKKATIEAIALEAGVATGTVYTYFPSKKRLFQSVVTDGFVEDLSRLTRDRIASFAQPDGLDVDVNMMRCGSGELLNFFVRNRKKVVILLGHGEGTKYGNFVTDYLREMEEQTLGQVRRQFPQIRIDETFSFMVRHFLVESVQWIVAILKEFENEDGIRAAFTATVGYQLAGINALVEWALSRG